MRGRGSDDGRSQPAAASPDAAAAPTIDAALDETQRPVLSPSPVAADPGAAHVVGAEQPGRYRSLREIGRGGMGRVTLVEDHQLGREVAMKELLAAVSADGAMSIGAVARFLREARVTGQLEHPSIVPVHEIGRRADGTLYYTMKRIRGRSLADALRDGDSLATRLKLVSAFRDVCHAVAYAHSRGVIHRDLKPDNVMVGEFGDTLVVDWGIAKVRGEPEANASAQGRVSVDTVGEAIQTLDGHAIGTPAYMSPEQARGDLAAIDERSDVWGLGAILFEILTGRPPFVGTSGLEVLSRVLEAPPPRVAEIAGDAPPELAAIADRALARDPCDRYASARELVADITAFQEGALVGAYAYSGWERARRFVRRNRAATIAATSIAVAVLVASGFVTRSYFAERAARGRAEASARSANVARGHAEASDLRARSSLADALLEKADRALADGDPHAAAIFAAATLVRAARVADDAAADEREDRARSVFADAEEAMHWTAARGLDDVTAMSSVSLDGRRVAVPDENGLTLIDVDTGDRTRVLAGRIERVICFVGQTQVLVRGARNGIVDLATGAFAHETAPATDGAATHERLAMSFGDGRVEVRDIATWQALDTIETAQRGWLRVALDPAGVRLAVWNRDDPWVEVYRAPRVGTPQRFDVASSPVRAAFSPDGAHLAVTVSGVGVRIIDTNGSTPMRVVPTSGWAGAVAWLAPDVVTNAENYRVAIRRLPAGELAISGRAVLAQGDSRLGSSRQCGEFVPRAAELARRTRGPSNERARKGRVVREAEPERDIDEARARIRDVMQREFAARFVDEGANRGAFGLEPALQRACGRPECACDVREGDTVIGQSFENRATDLTRDADSARQLRERFGRVSFDDRKQRARRVRMRKCEVRARENETVTVGVEANWPSERSAVRLGVRRRRVAQRDFERHDCLMCADPRECQNAEHRVDDCGGGRADRTALMIDDQLRALAIDHEFAHGLVCDIERDALISLHPQQTFSERRRGQEDQHRERRVDLPGVLDHVQWHVGIAREFGQLEPHAGQRGEGQAAVDVVQLCGIEIEVRDHRLARQPTCGRVREHIEHVGRCNGTDAISTIVCPHHAMIHGRGVQAATAHCRVSYSPITLTITRGRGARPGRT